MKRWLIFLTPAYPRALVYMLQSTEYETSAYLRWWWRTRDFTTVAYRRNLDHTRAAFVLLGGLYVCTLLYILIISWLAFSGSILLACVLVVLYPFALSHAVILPIWLGRIFIVDPRRRKEIQRSERIFAEQSKNSSIIAIVGSYGKTSMKELLYTVLSGHLKVAATPANKNVAISHARFANSLAGDEDVIIIEYGEGAPGDIARFARVTHPTHAIITGIAPAHLDHYKTLDAAARDILSITQFVPTEQIFANNNSDYVRQYATGKIAKYDNTQAFGWKISDATISISGTSFTMRRNNMTIKINSGLLGEHNIGPLACVAALAYEFGMSAAQIEDSVTQTKPHEHRMQPYRIGRAWVIDDTYNGNIEGILAGTKFLSAVSAVRKIYVTPGLVDQGEETIPVHVRMGECIAAAAPNLVVLMNNSVTEYIREGLKNAKYEGDVRIEDDPLTFYQNLSHFVADGDVIMMQNDWTDNYH